MSVVVLTTINCDWRVAPRCWFYDTEGSSENAKQLRAGLVRRGWKVGLPGGLDACPACARVADVSKPPAML
jgi:hypothetical protein